MPTVRASVCPCVRPSVRASHFSFACNFAILGCINFIFGSYNLFMKWNMFLTFCRRVDFRSSVCHTLTLPTTLQSLSVSISCVRSTANNYWPIALLLYRYLLWGQGQHDYRFSTKSEIQHGRHGAIFQKSAVSLCALYKVHILSNVSHILYACAIGQGQHAYRFWYRSKIQDGRHCRCCMLYPLRG
jgi:hypothetical protein